MNCKKCKGELRVLRTCGRIQILCRCCKQEYPVQEYVEHLDPETKELYRFYNASL